MNTMYNVFTFRESTYHNYLCYKYLGQYTEYDAENIELNDEIFWLPVNDHDSVYLFVHNDILTFVKRYTFKSINDISKNWIKIYESNAPNYIEGVDYYNKNKDLYACIIII